MTEGNMGCPHEEGEDFPLGERMQIGFESGGAEEVIYGRNEPSLVHFHTSIRNALGVAA